MGEPSLRERALRHLARRDHSRAELARKLAHGGQAITGVRAALGDGLLDLPPHLLEQRGPVRGIHAQQQGSGLGLCHLFYDR